MNIFHEFHNYRTKKMIHNEEIYFRFSITYPHTFSIDGAVRNFIRKFMVYNPIPLITSSFFQCIGEDTVDGHLVTLMDAES